MSFEPWLSQKTQTGLNIDFLPECCICLLKRAESFQSGCQRIQSLRWGLCLRKNHQWGPECDKFSPYWPPFCRLSPNRAPQVLQRTSRHIRKFWSDFSRWNQHPQLFSFHMKNSHRSTFGYILIHLCQLCLLGKLVHKQICLHLGSWPYFETPESKVDHFLQKYPNLIPKWIGALRLW